MFTCKHCNKEYESKQSKSNHQWRCKENPEYKRPAFFDSAEYKDKQSKIVKNNSHLYKTDEYKDKQRKNTTKYYSDPKNREKQSVAMKAAVLKNPDSYSKSNVSGRVKSIEYEGYTFKGYWELEVGKYLLENSFSFEQVSEPIPYFWNEKWHLYFPDFYLADHDVYLEVKGYQRDRDLAKWSVMDRLIVLKKKEIDSIKKKDFDLTILLKEYTQRK